MPERAYIVAVDARTVDKDIAAIKDYIQTSSSINNWWNYIPCVFIVISPLTADAISEELKPLTRDTSLLVIEANLENSEGWLPERAWSWIRRRTQRPRTGLAKVGLTPQAPQV